MDNAYLPPLGQDGGVEPNTASSDFGLYASDNASPAPTNAAGYFTPGSLTTFAGSYPERPHTLKHSLNDHPLLKLDALCKLAGALPAKDIEHAKATVPVGLNGKAPANGLSIEETIKQIAECDSWAVLKNIEQVPAYNALLLALLEELRPSIEKRTGKMLNPQGFIFISSPYAVTPYHFDPEHNILLQLKGSKVMAQFPAGDTRFAPDVSHENYHTGGPRELRWTGAMAAFGRDYSLQPGEALYVPVMAPHFVTVRKETSISLSITWRSEWSYAEADARCFNSVLRRVGFSPRAPGRWPASNMTKANLYRIYRKIGLAN